MGKFCWILGLSKLQEYLSVMRRLKIIGNIQPSFLFTGVVSMMSVELHAKESKIRISY